MGKLQSICKKNLCCLPDSNARTAAGVRPAMQHKPQAYGDYPKAQRQRSVRQGGLWGFVLLIALALKASGATFQPATIAPPKPVRELRAVWVASVSNIDWPSRPGLSTADQKAELLAILNRASQLKLNTVVLQIRPACDALYASKLEPWSEYLTGTMGKAPAPYYDPLAFAVAEAHKRGLELHAWFNPYRALHNSAKSPISANHISKTRPDLVRQYGNLLWLDPGEKEVQEHSLAVVMDVVKRYDIDGIHFDDYFYPYKQRDAKGDIDFPDDASWRRIGSKTKMTRDDWRRENVNSFIERAYKAIKTTKPWVKFGVSPFGIWRPGYPAQIEGHDAYAKLYADSRKWLTSGWLDYFAPQLYWAIDPPEQSFPVLLKWWGEQNPKGRLLVPGLDCTKTRDKWKPEEIVNQIRLARKQPGAAGHVLWNMRSVMRNPELADTLKSAVYSEPALPPAIPWAGGSVPAKPELTARPKAAKTTVSWGSSSDPQVYLWLLQTRKGGAWTTAVIPRIATSHTVTDTPDAVALTAVNRHGALGPTASLERR
jgi:uncharacterized lipoprotein YddW (UPF0748 family)